MLIYLYVQELYMSQNVIRLMVTYDLRPLLFNAVYTIHVYVNEIIILLTEI